MSMYELHKMLFRLRNSEEFEKRFRADPLKALDEFQLGSDEREALERGDVRRLYEMGAHAYLLNQIAGKGLGGITRENYLARIRGEESV